MTEEDFEEDRAWTPFEVLQWLRQRSLKHAAGTDHFAKTAELIRSLLADRKAALAQVDTLNQEIARLQKLKTPQPFDAGSQGTWGEHLT